jgi:CBS domain containing-hemolysin-like protein
MCSLLETVILSTTHAHIQVELKKGRRYAKILEHFKDNVNRPLSAILTINTLAQTAGGAAVGAQVHKMYGDKNLAIFSGVMTILVLVVGEFAPKVIGSNHWKALAPVSAYLMKMLVIAVYPMVWLAEHLAKALGGNEDALVSREEVIVTAEMGADEGSIRPKESAIIKNLLMLDNMKVSDIMTPRAVMYAYETGATVGEIMAKHKPVRFSRIPVFHNDLDHILGVVHRYKILEAASNDHDSVRLDDIMTPIHAIPENISVAAALDQFIKRHEHIFLVIDDYGSTTGIVSLEDAIETLLGVEIVDEFDSVADLRQLALEQWRERKQKLTGSAKS